MSLHGAAKEIINYVTTDPTKWVDVEAYPWATTLLPVARWQERGTSTHEGHHEGPRTMMLVAPHTVVAWIVDKYKQPNEQDNQLIFELETSNSV